MLKAIDRFASSIPSAGMALHGTNRENAEKICRSGLRGRCGNHVMLLPSSTIRKLHSENRHELSERIIGAALRAWQFAINKSNLGNLPAVVIFTGTPGGDTFKFSMPDSKFQVYERPKWKPVPFLEEPPPTTIYRTFGSVNTFPLPPDSVVAAIYMSDSDFLDATEHVNALMQVSNPNFAINYHLMGKLVVRTVSALADVAECPIPK